MTIGNHHDINTNNDVASSASAANGMLMNSHMMIVLAIITIISTLVYQWAAPKRTTKSTHGNGIGIGTNASSSNDKAHEHHDGASSLSVHAPPTPHQAAVPSLFSPSYERHTANPSPEPHSPIHHDGKLSPLFTSLPTSSSSSASSASSSSLTSSSTTSDDIPSSTLSFSSTTTDTATATVRTRAISRGGVDCTPRAFRVYFGPPAASSPTTTPVPLSEIDEVKKRPSLNWANHRQSIGLFAARQHMADAARMECATLVQACESSTIRYSDDEFKPCNQSLYGRSSPLPSPTHSSQLASSSSSTSTPSGTSLAPPSSKPSLSRPTLTRQSRAASSSSSSSSHPQVREWRRISDMRHPDGPWEVIKEGIAPSDISQGELGNCWFLSALAVLAEIPELIENILMNHAYNNAGVFQVRLCKDGIWKVVTIDDYFPVNASGQLAYGKSNGPELWVAIIEKAYAKLHGSYAAIESGQMHDAFQDLTGAPCTTIRFETGVPNIDAIWTEINKHHDCGYLLCASCGGDRFSAEMYEKSGLRKNHAYSILGMAQLDQGARLVKFRNPWGHGEWSGDWSDTSACWTDELREELRVENKNDGIFWMAMEDVVKYFRYIDVCKLKDHWHDLRLADSFSGLASSSPTDIASKPSIPLFPSFPTPLSLTKSDSGSASSAAAEFTSFSSLNRLPFTCGAMYSLTVPNSTQIFISLVQPDKRGTAALKPYVYNDIGVTIMSYDLGHENDYKTHELVSAIMPASDRSITSEIQLEGAEGRRYLVVPTSFLPASAPDTATFPFVMSVYSERAIFCTTLPVSYPVVINAQHMVASSHGAKHALDEYTISYSTPKGYSIHWLIENHHDTEHLIISFDASASTGLISSRGAMKTCDSVPPGHRQIIAVFAVVNKFAKYSLRPNYSITRQLHSLGHEPELEEVDFHRPMPLP